MLKARNKTDFIIVPPDLDACRLYDVSTGSDVNQGRYERLGSERESLWRFPGVSRKVGGAGCAPATGKPRLSRGAARQLVWPRAGRSLKRANNENAHKTPAGLCLGGLLGGWGSCLTSSRWE